MKLDRHAILTDIIAGLVLYVLRPLLGPAIVGVLILGLFVVLLDTATGGTALQQVANMISGWILQLKGG